MPSATATPRSIALFGGTFDPIHQGHVQVTEMAKQELGLDSVIFLPCRKSPHKLDTRSALTEHRLAMCELAVADYTWAEVHDHDLTAPSPSYSWKTAEYFKGAFPKAKLYWIMGTDQWNALHKWARYEYLLSLVSMIVCTRGSESLKERELTPHVIPSEHPASSSAIRNALRQGEEAQWLHSSVKDYIQEQRLYNL